MNIKVDVLMSHIKKTKTCWLWQSGLTHNGYARGCKGGRRVHRVMYELFVAQIPKGMFVLHKCDVRHCVNPNHLFVGTAKDNTQDMIAKGRARNNPPKGKYHYLYGRNQPASTKRKLVKAWKRRKVKFAGNKNYVRT